MGYRAAYAGHRRVGSWPAQCNWHWESVAANCVSYNRMLWRRVKDKSSVYLSAAPAVSGIFGSGTSEGSPSAPRFRAGGAANLAPRWIRRRKGGVGQEGVVGDGRNKFVARGFRDDVPALITYHSLRPRLGPILFQAGANSRLGDVTLRRPKKFLAFDVLRFQGPLIFGNTPTGRNVPHLKGPGCDGGTQTTGATAIPNFAEKAGGDNSNTIHRFPMEPHRILNANSNSAKQTAPRATFFINFGGTSEETSGPMREDGEVQGFREEVEENARFTETWQRSWRRRFPKSSGNSAQDSRHQNPLPRILFPGIRSESGASILAARLAIYHPCRLEIICNIKFPLNSTINRKRTTTKRRQDGA